MKKFFSLFCVFSLLFLASCARQERCDIYDFAKSFSSSNDEFKIETKNLTAEENEDEINFPFVFDDKFLLSVKTDEKTSFVKSLSVVFLFKENYSISDEDFSAFLKISSSAIKAFTNEEISENVFENLSLKSKKDVSKYTHASFTLGFYDYSLVATAVGLCFSIERR